jgi:predicted phosphodiesterase
MTLRFAVLSDVHGNLEAFQAVLAAIDTIGIDRIIALGDIVGYGPDPEACLRLAFERCAAMVLGNHDFGAVHPQSFHGHMAAVQALVWARTRLAANAPELLARLGSVPAWHREGEIVFVHGSARHPFEYVLEQDSRGLSTFEETIASIARDFADFRLCFVGHNHQPFLATSEGFLHPHEENRTFFVGSGKLYVSVGSVGQPRDRDPRACFVTLEDQKLTFHRVPYPFAVTAAKIRSYGLPASLAARLERGT